MDFKGLARLFAHADKLVAGSQPNGIVGVGQLGDQGLDLWGRFGCRQRLGHAGGNEDKCRNDRPGERVPWHKIHRSLRVVVVLVRENSHDSMTIRGTGCNRRATWPWTANPRESWPKCSGEKEKCGRKKVTPTKRLNFQSSLHADAGFHRSEEHTS